MEVCNYKEVALELFLATVLKNSLMKLASLLLLTCVSVWLVPVFLIELNDSTNYR